MLFKHLFPSRLSVVRRLKLKTSSRSLTCKERNFSLNCHGFSILELIISAGALGFFAILVQSMLVLGHSFTKSQQNLFESFQNTRLIKQNICIANSSFKNINVDPNQSYTKEDKLCQDNTLSSCAIKKDANGNNVLDLEGNPVYIKQYTRTYSKLPSASESEVTPLLRLYIGNLSSEANFKNINITKDSIDNRINENNIEFKDEQPYYKVYQNSHTIVKVIMDISHGGSGFVSGYIFASRCLNHIKSTHSAYDDFTTFNPNTKQKSAMYILEVLKKKPFYFPSTSGEEVLKCCNANTPTPSNCVSASKEWVPRIYVIHLDKMSPNTPDPDSEDLAGFPAQVAHIQELPELQDLNTTWGVGFMLSMDEKIKLSQSSFHLETMILKNNCATSVTSIQKCTSLSFGTNPETQSLIGVADIKMSDFINFEISNCSGYSSGVDATSVIRL